MITFQANSHTCLGEAKLYKCHPTCFLLEISRTNTMLGIVVTWASDPFEDWVLVPFVPNQLILVYALYSKVVDQSLSNKLMIINCMFLSISQIFVFQVGKSIMAMIKTNQVCNLVTYMQVLCKSSFDNDRSTTLLSCAICGVWEKEGRHVCHMPISLRVNTSTATTQNVGQEHTVFSTSLLQNHISKSYQKFLYQFCWHC